MTTLRLHQLLDGFDVSGSLYSLVQKIESTAKAADRAVGTWVARSEDRRQLARMSDRLLNDIGLNRFEVAIEINKPFWKK